MSKEPTEKLLDKENFDYDAFYRGQPATADAQLPSPRVPWDIGEPQPAVVELARTTTFRDDVLDAGCGPGDNAILLGRQGYRVTGFDNSPTALTAARNRAAAAGVGADVEFVQADATTLTELAGRRFATVLDSALYHCLSDEQRRRYVAALHRVTEPGADLHLVCWAPGTPGVTHPMEVREENLRSLISTHWEIAELRTTSLSTAVVPQTLTEAEIEQFGQVGVTVDLDRVKVDIQGRITGPAWYLHGVRRADPVP